MQLRFFLVPVAATDEAAAELNRFLASHRVLAVERQFIGDGPNSAWTICVSFDDSGATGTPRPGIGKRGKVDFKDVLSHAEFAVFARLRALRKEKADAEGVPAYAVFTNEQLAEMVQQRIGSAEALRDIAGVGAGRAEKYGKPFLEVLAQAALPASVAAPDET
jgi:superfamily II DNA helicase RecQ